VSRHLEMGRIRESLSRIAWWRRRGQGDTLFLNKYGIRFRDASLLEHAMTHRSSLGPEDTVISNERLEFLGDSVLGLVATESLFRSFPDADEGELTKARSRVVNKNVLGKIGLDLGILEVLNYARDEIKDDERALVTLSADALEAVIGAIYLDAGFDSAARFVQENVIEAAASSPEDHAQADFKSKLQEICQAQFRVQPQYKVVRRIGPEHRKVFHVEVLIRNRPYGLGSGRSKKEAEQQAAGAAIRKLEAAGRASSQG